MCLLNHGSANKGTISDQLFTGATIKPSDIQRSKIKQHSSINHSWGSNNETIKLGQSVALLLVVAESGRNSDATVPRFGANIAQNMNSKI